MTRPTPALMLDAIRNMGPFATTVKRAAAPHRARRDARQVMVPA